MERVNAYKLQTEYFIQKLANQLSGNNDIDIRVFRLFNELIEYAENLQLKLAEGEYRHMRYPKKVIENNNFDLSLKSWVNILNHGAISEEDFDRNVRTSLCIYFMPFFLTNEKDERSLLNNLKELGLILGF